MKQQEGFIGKFLENEECINIFNIVNLLGGVKCLFQMLYLQVNATRREASTTGSDSGRTSEVCWAWRGPGTGRGSTSSGCGSGSRYPRDTLSGRGRRSGKNIALKSALLSQVSLPWVTDRALTPVQSPGTSTQPPDEESFIKWKPAIRYREIDGGPRLAVMLTLGLGDEKGENHSDSGYIVCLASSRLTLAGSALLRHMTGSKGPIVIVDLSIKVVIGRSSFTRTRCGSRSVSCTSIAGMLSPRAPNVTSYVRSSLSAPMAQHEEEDHDENDMIYDHHHGDPKEPERHSSLPKSSSSHSTHHAPSSLPSGELLQLDIALYDATLNDDEESTVPVEAKPPLKTLDISRPALALALDVVHILHSDYQQHLYGVIHKKMLPLNINNSCLRRSSVDFVIFYKKQDQELKQMIVMKIFIGTLFLKCVI